MGEVRMPERDEDRRKIYYSMLHITRKAGKRFTVEELEDICIGRGYLTIDKEEKKTTAVKPIPPTDKSVGILGVIL